MSCRAQLASCVYHAGCAPDVGRRAVTGSNQHLQRAVLSGLDVVGEVLVLPERRRRCSLNANAKCENHSLSERELTTQQALPKSAILTSSLSALAGSRGFTSRFPVSPDRHSREELELNEGGGKKVKGIKKRGRGKPTTAGG